MPSARLAKHLVSVSFPSWNAPIIAPSLPFHQTTLTYIQFIAYQSEVLVGMRTRQILVDGAPVGLQGLDAIFESLKAEGLAAGDENLAEKLVRRVGRDNYIPYTARQAYAAALSQAYAAYLAGQVDNGSSSQRGRGSWRGYSREQIPWYPTLNEDLCNGCGVCLRLCSAKALAPLDDGRVFVVEPLTCVVGCGSCATACKPGAIIFPPRSMLDVYTMRSR